MNCVKCAIKTIKNVLLSYDHLVLAGLASGGDLCVDPGVLLVVIFILVAPVTDLVVAAAILA
jgi:hypothetical protein